VVETVPTASRATPWQPWQLCNLWNLRRRGGLLDFATPPRWCGVFHSRQNVLSCTCAVRAGDTPNRHGPAITSGLSEWPSDLPAASGISAT